MLSDRGDTYATITNQNHHLLSNLGIQPPCGKGRLYFYLVREGEPGVHAFTEQYRASYRALLSGEMSALLFRRKNKRIKKVTDGQLAKRDL